MGLGRVAGEVAARVYHSLVHGARDRQQAAGLASEIRARIPASYQRPPVHEIGEINSTEAECLLRDRLKAEVCVLMLHPLVKENIFRIPRHGMLVFHPGIVPEYRGVHSAFWALRQGRPDLVGWSLLRIDHGVDTGGVLAQGRLDNVNPARESFVAMQHRAHMEGIPRVAETLLRIEAGEDPSVVTGGRLSQNFTQPRWIDYMAYLREIRRP